MLLGVLSRITPSGTLISLAVIVAPGSKLLMTIRPSSPVTYSPLSGPTTAPEIFGLDVEHGGHPHYVYLDYEPVPGIRFRHLANYREIKTWIFQERGLKVPSAYITQVKRKHGIITQGGQSRPLPEGKEPVEVPPEIESAIEAALRHFGLL